MEPADVENLQKTLVRNKRHFLRYNQFRKDVFKSFDGKFKILTPGEMVKKENLG